MVCPPRVSITDAISQWLLVSSPKTHKNEREHSLLGDVRSAGVTWSKLESDADIPAFIEAAVALHRTIFDRLPTRDRPSFFDAWLRVFNYSRAYLLAPGGDPAALVTVPRAPDAHGYRWQQRTLAFRDEMAGELVLPADVDLARSFTVPCRGGPFESSPLAATTHEEVDLGYVRALGGDDTATEAPKPLHFRDAEPGELDAIIELLDRSYAEFQEGPPDLTRQREELREIFAHDAGWCVVAVMPDAPAPIAMASYIMLHVPLAGVAAPLVGDLAVEPAYRRRGIARGMQQHAARRLRADGCRWLFGSISPDNTASRGQAEATGRTIWYRGLFFKPA